MVFVQLMLSADVAASCHGTSVCILPSVCDTRNEWCPCDGLWSRVGWQLSITHCPSPPACATASVHSPLPSQHTFMGMLLSFRLTLAHAEPLLPALLRHPSSPVHLSWSRLQLLCLSPHHQLSHQREVLLSMQILNLCFPFPRVHLWDIQGNKCFKQPALCGSAVVDHRG